MRAFPLLLLPMLLSLLYEEENKYLYLYLYLYLQIAIQELKIKSCLGLNEILSNFAVPRKWKRIFVSILVLFRR